MKVILFIFLCFFGLVYSQPKLVAPAQKNMVLKDSLQKKKIKTLPKESLKDLSQSKFEIDKVQLDTLAAIDLTIPLFLPDSLKVKSFKINALTSYYADKFHGRRTASGEKYDKTKLTAAHKKLPFGTKLKVTNEANGKSVIVVVNDRGPFTKGRELDLSKAAFLKITRDIGHGILRATIEIVE